MLELCDTPEIVAVVLDGSVVTRLDKGVITERMREAFPGLFDAPITPIGDVLRRHGYDA